MPPRALLLLALLVTGCGARTGLLDLDAAPLPPECTDDASCDDHLWCDGVETCHEGHCVPGAPFICQAPDVCTDNACDEASRACRPAPVSADADGDGFRGPRPGTRVGDANACGNDCDDANAAVHPGATEVCNGVDDDCNAVVDDNATLTATGDPIRVSATSTAPSGPGGVAWTGDHYAASHWGYADSKAHVYFSQLARDGSLTGAPPQQQLTTMPADAFGASLAWTGRILGAVWQDRRDPSGGFEVYFNRLTPTGDKLGPDQRISFARGFSINASIAWTGEVFVLVWQDERDDVGSGAYELYAQRVDVEGRLVGPNVRLTRDPANSESPSVAVSDTGAIGVAWMDGRGGNRGIWFMALDANLARLTPTDVRMSGRTMNAVGAALVWNRDRWVLAWYDDDDMTSPDHEVWGTALLLNGSVLVAPRRLTSDPNFSRYPSLLPLGDRVVLAWADDRIDGRYSLFARVLSSALDPLSPESPITRPAGPTTASAYPVLTRGPAGDVGVLFRDQRDGRIQTWFTRMLCAIPR